MSTCFAEAEIARLDPAAYERIAPEPALGGGASLKGLCAAALADPVGCPPLGELVRAARRVAVIVSDASRDEPRAEMLDAIFSVVPRAAATIVVATGTHARSVDVVPRPFADVPVVTHDPTDDACIELGRTREGTPVRIAPEVARADLVVATGRIRPHYFAGYSGGVKAVFPGCAHRDGILQNHLLKADPTARLARVDDNRCRADMEEAAALLPGRLVILNVLADCDGAPVAAAFGDPIAAHRRLVARADALFTVTAPRSPVVVVADRPPVTRTLYQASKLLPPAGAVLSPGGTVVLVAECDEGVGPLERVNDGIYRLGVAPQLPEHRVVLVSRLDDATVRGTYATPAPSLAETVARATERHAARALLLWRAGEIVTRVSGSLEPAEGP